MKRIAVGLVLVGLALVASPVVLHRAGAAADTTPPGSGLGGYKLSSRAAGVEVIYNDGSEVDLTVPYAQTDAGIGTGHALAADVYPGPVGGNPGATIKQFLGSHLPPALADGLGTLTYPAKAEAYNTGPTDSTFPENGPPQGITNVAHVDANGGSMNATGAVVQVGGINSRAVSTTTINNNSVTTVATSTVSDVDIAALVHVGEITSDATASSDGTTGQGSGSTTIAGLTVAGMSVSVTPSGIVLGPTIAPIAIGPLVNMVLSAVGVTLTLSPIEHVVSGAKAVEHAPALLISIDIPHNGGNTFQVIIGGAEAEAQASPGFTSSSPTSPPSATSTSGSTGSFSPASTGTTGNSGSSSPLPSSTNSAASPGESASSGGGAPVKFTNALPVDATKGLGAGLVIFGLLVGAAAAFGLGKIPDDVLADKPPSVCPNERSGS